MSAGAALAAMRKHSPRVCACGCETVFDGYGRQRFFNAAHRKAAWAKAHPRRGKE